MLMVIEILYKSAVLLGHLTECLFKMNLPQQKKFLLAYLRDPYLFEFKVFVVKIDKNLI